MTLSTHMKWPAVALLGLSAIMLMATIGPTPSLANEQELISDNPLSGDEEAILSGQKIFNTFCTQCHGVAADGIAPRFGKYSADLRKFNKGFYEFAGIVVEGITDKQMPPWGDYLDGEQISQISAYLETLAIDGAKWAADE